jgi:predicted amidohydrolase
MLIALIQPDIRWQDCKGNLAALEGLLDRARGADLAVLPEMFAYGFVTQPEGVAEGPDGPALRWMKEEAAARGFALAGSIPTELKGPSWRNRFHFVTPDGADTFYDKHHLFTYGGEHLRYSPGNERVVVEWRGVRILLQVCYDLRFPSFSRNRADAPYDLALYVASWPAVRGEAWSALLKARAIENQSYVIAVNRVGTDAMGIDYEGHSCVIDPVGRTMVSCTKNAEQAVETVLDKKDLLKMREHFRVLDDRDQFTV